ncbi:MAG TPA: efflux RND transporter periplasmic adaptor subunit [Myxococcota bacterium]|nr:efflux RND transporter periplasmic adaptor subunit [Myxococcota bacterium]
MSSGPSGRRDGELARDLEALRLVERPDPLAPTPQRRRRGAWLAASALLLVALAGFFAWRQLTKPTDVELVAVTLREIGAPPVVLTASGYIEARRQITVSSKAQGKIVEMPVEENARVKAGDLIARLEDDEQRASLSLAEAEYADRQRELVRKQELFARGSTSQGELDRAKTAFEVADARRELAQVLLANTVLRAPIDGTVIRKLREQGEFLTIGVTAEGDPGTSVVTLADLGSLEVALEIGESEIRKIAVGDVALVTPEAQRERRYLADVIEIAAMADREKGVVPVRVRIREPDAALLPDMTAKVAFLEREPDAPIEVAAALPAAAVVSRGGADVVFAVEDDRAHAVPVRTRPAGDGWLALVEGPEEGRYVVSAPPASLEDGARVRVPTP